LSAHTNEERDANVLTVEKYDPWLCIPRTSLITHFVEEEYTSQY